MKNICVIKTGGTIGSVAKGGIVSLDENKKGDVSALCSRGGVEFCVQSPLNILSENITCSDMEEMQKCILAVDVSKFDGIILTHGTDTLAFSACYLAIALADLKIPVVIVSANFPLENENSNGKANFNGAVDFICGKYHERNENSQDGENSEGNENSEIGENIESCKDGEDCKTRSGDCCVYVSYQNPGENTKIHRGDLILNCTGKMGYFYSWEDNFVCEFEKMVACEGDNSCVSVFKKSEKYKQNKDHIGVCGWKIGNLQLARSGGKLCKKVLGIKAVAFCDYSLFDLSACDVVVVESFHSGTVKSSGANSFVEFAKAAAKKNIPVVVSGALDGDVYQSTEALLGLDNVVMFSGSFEFAYILAAMGGF